jgi:hypothetical protein
MNTRRIEWLAAGLVLLLAAAAPASERAPCHMEDYRLASGPHDGEGDEERVAFETVVRIEGAAWLQLVFGECDLGDESALVITSLRDGASETLTGQGLAWRRSRSAGFNGDAVELALLVAPGDRGVGLEVRAVLVGERGSRGGERDICYGDDQRMASYDEAVCRTFPAGGTAFISAWGYLVTAGHVVNPIGDFQIVEFDVPASEPDGTIRLAAPEDQYTIDHASVHYNEDGDYGNDWGVFTCLPNPITGLAPIEARQAFYRLTKDFHPEYVRVTGFGADTHPPGTTGGGNEDNRTLQTDSHYFLQEVVDSENDVWIEHTVDTEGGSSGSPLLDIASSYAIGIHEWGGCDPPDTGNKATSFENDLIEAVLNGYLGAGVVHVDAGHPSPFEMGLPLRPFDSVSEAVSVVPPGGTIAVVTGSYDEALVIDKALTIEVPAGPVVIGE